MKKFTFIILHGWGLSAQRFTPLARELKKMGHRAFVPDLPGFGASKSPTAPLTLSDYVAFLRSYIKQNKIERPILLGHSFGGRVSIKYQSEYPNDIRALVLTGTPGVTPVAKKKIYIAVALAKVGKFFLSIPPLSLIKEKVRSWYYFVVGASDYYRASPVMRQTFKNIVQEDLAGYMSSVQVPCALCWGQGDIITPVWVADRMCQIIPKAELIIIPGSDHGVSYKQPKLFVSAMQPFLMQL